jgi:pimeloyl-ACP methyl ester carboxylesterase
VDTDRRSRQRAVDEKCVLVEGDWTHRFVHANGSRFHVVEAGSGPLILLLHGFPEFWWGWHRQLADLAGAGYRAVAADLRGYGATDKPPRGYDGFTLAADVVGLIRALGERDAVLVGAGAGGMIAWTTAAFHPRMVRRLVVVGAAHPLRLRSAILTDVRGQTAASVQLLRFQIPRYEHQLTRDGAAAVGELLDGWVAPSFRNTIEYAEIRERYREAIRIPLAMFCALEAYRWAFRSVLRWHGYQFTRQLREPIVTPTLQLHGALDTACMPSTAQGSGRYALAEYEWRLLDGVGHFPHLEAPDLITGEILRWAKS